MIRLIAEIGINHFGDKEKALRLIKIASSSGCWGVKFQYRQSDFFSKNDEMGSTLIRDELETSNLSDSILPELVACSKENGLAIGFSFFRELDLIHFYNNISFKIDFIKIPSPEFRNYNLITQAKEKSNCVMISYGAGEEEEIKNAIKKSELRKSDVVFHCISNYPVANGNQQLSFLKRLKKFSDAMLGYSSHDQDWEINVIAAQYGISYIERHLCESKNDIGLDISSSSDYNEFNKLNLLLSYYENIIVSKKRIPNQGEILNSRNLGTSLYASSNISKKDIFSESLFVEKSPRIGITKDQLKSLDVKKFSAEIKKGNPLLFDHFISVKDKISENLSFFANKQKISIPVRLHDFDLFKNKFKTSFFEFHFSYKEIFHLSKTGFSELLDKIHPDYTISIHLPDYINKDNLIDPFSTDMTVFEKSNSIINTCTSLANKIQSKTKKECLLLGSFSVNSFDTKSEFYLRFKSFLDSYKSQSVLIIAQWLPKKAWYFGGTIEVDLFCSEEDIEFCLEYDIPICLDIAHLILSANYYNKDWKVWYYKLLKNCKHIHLSDAEGTDGEGVKFGLGDLHSENEILNLNCVKVLEIWEGHLNQGEEFENGLKYLSSKI